jgi:hypothetical protein
MEFHIYLIVSKVFNQYHTESKEVEPMRDEDLTVVLLKFRDVTTCQWVRGYK